MKLIDRLELYRLENKLSQKELAKLLGVHWTTVSGWLTGKRMPRKIHVYQIGKFLDRMNREAEHE